MKHMKDVSNLELAFIQLEFMIADFRAREREIDEAVEFKALDLMLSNALESHRAVQIVIGALTKQSFGASGGHGNEIPQVSSRA